MQEERMRKKQGILDIAHDAYPGLIDVYPDENAERRLKKKEERTDARTVLHGLFSKGEGQGFKDVASIHTAWLSDVRKHCDALGIEMTAQDKYDGTSLVKLGHNKKRLGMKSKDVYFPARDMAAAKKARVIRQLQMREPTMPMQESEAEDHQDEETAQRVLLDKRVRSARQHTAKWLGLLTNLNKSN